MKKEEKIIVEGRVLETLPNAMFRVEIDLSAAVMTSTPGGSGATGSSESSPAAASSADSSARQSAPATGPVRKHIILAHICGKMRMHYIKILQGDKVKVELSPYDMTRGRIIYRNK